MLDCLSMAFKHFCDDGSNPQCNSCFTHGFCITFFVHSDLFFLLHKNLLHTPSFSSTSASAKSKSPRTTERRRNSTERGAIQKDSDHRSLGPSVISNVLSPIWFIVWFYNHPWIEYTTLSVSFCFNSSSDAFLLNSEPIAVLLEDERVKASSKGHYKKVLLLITARRNPTVS